MRRDNLYDIVNRSVNQTMGRTVITAGTALLSALALFLFGGEVLHGFAFTMIVGIITGTYSSVFIAAAIAVIWQGRAQEARQAGARRRRPHPRRRRRRRGKPGAPPCLVSEPSRFVTLASSPRCWGSSRG